MFAFFIRVCEFCPQLVSCPFTPVITDNQCHILIYCYLWMICNIIVIFLFIIVVGWYVRFEIEGDDLDFTAGERTQIRAPSPNYIIPSPPRQDQRQEVQQPHHVFDEMVQMQEVQENAQQGQGPLRGRRRKRRASVIDNDQTIHPAHVYQSWLQDTSDIVSRRRRNPKVRSWSPSISFNGVKHTLSLESVWMLCHHVENLSTINVLSLCFLVAAQEHNVYCEDC